MATAPTIALNIARGRVIKAGVCIEASFKRGKSDVGREEDHVRTWQGWHHYKQLPGNVVVSLDAPCISICRWLQVIHENRLAPLSNALFSTPRARKRYRATLRFHQY